MMTSYSDAMPTPTAIPRRPILPRWPGVVFPVVIVSAIGFAVTHSVNNTILPVALTLATTIGLGLISGLVVRWTLRGRASPLRLLISLVALMVGLLTLGLITRGEAGVGPLSPTFDTTDWFGLGHIALAALSAWLALQSWQPKHVGPTLLERWQALRARAQEQWETSTLYRGIVRGREWFARARNWIRNLQLPPALSPVASRSRVHARPIPFPRFKWNAVERLREILSRHNGALYSLRPSQASHIPHIRFTGVEEQRCPYCLEIIERNDPRGVELCPICHTPHHADCWAVTGMCQVPHHHTEVH